MKTAAIKSPVHAGTFVPNKFAILPELGNNHNAIDAIIAPAKRYGLRRPNLDLVLSESAPIKGCTTIPVNGPASQIKPYNHGVAPRPSVTGAERIILICHANCNPKKPNAKFKKLIVVNRFSSLFSLIIHSLFFFPVFCPFYGKVARCAVGSVLSVNRLTFLL